MTSNTFSLHLLDATHSERIDGIVSFVGEDASGSFGILAGHTRFMTTLVFGLARFRLPEQSWRYLALPGAVLNFSANELSIISRRYLLDDDYERISATLQAQLLAEEENLRGMKQSLRQMEQQVLQRMWQLGQEQIRQQ